MIKQDIDKVIYHKMRSVWPDCSLEPLTGVDRGARCCLCYVTDIFHHVDKLNFACQFKETVLLSFRI